jgi:hypothetical protein
MTTAQEAIAIARSVDCWREPITADMLAKIIDAALAAQPSQPQTAQPQPLTFEQAWATYEARGFRYGSDALEQVRLGWRIAHEVAEVTQPSQPQPKAQTP